MFIRPTTNQLELYLGNLVLIMSMSDEESLEERNLVNLVLYYKAKLKRIQKGVSAVKLLSVEERTHARERLHPREPRPDGCLRGLHSGLWHREAGAQAEHSLLRLRMEPGVDGCARGRYASIGVGAGFCCVWGSSVDAFRGVLGLMFSEEGHKSRCKHFL